MGLDSPAYLCFSLQEVEGRGFAYLEGLIMYCIYKDNMEEHFDFVQHNVSANDMNEGKT